MAYGHPYDTDYRITRKVTTVCNGKHEVWSDHEEAKAYFPELLMIAERRSMNVQSAFIFISFMGCMSVRRNMKKTAS